MPGVVTRAVAVAACVLLLAACAGDTPPAGQQVSDSPTSSALTPSAPTPPSAGTARASPSGPPPGRGGAAKPGPVATERDVRLMRSFVSFAVRPTSISAAGLPLAEEIALGLGPGIEAILDRTDAPDRSAWALTGPLFRAHTGPFHALATIQRHAEEAGSRSLGVRGGPFAVSVGDHGHCAGPPTPAPPGFENDRRVSVQPSRSSIDSCLSWFTVDLFLDGNGTIRAVTLDVWEP